jgi:hypothetical protein
MYFVLFKILEVINFYAIKLKFNNAYLLCLFKYSYIYDS